MATETGKYRNFGTHKRAILHMIGQSVDTFASKPTTAEIAAWMNVSKPTARKYLKEMLDSGEVVMTEEKYRANAFIHKWSLGYLSKEQFLNDEFKRDYELYAQRVLKVII